MPVSRQPGNGKQHVNRMAWRRPFAGVRLSNVCLHFPGLHPHSLPVHLQALTSFARGVSLNPESVLH